MEKLVRMIEYMAFVTTHFNSDRRRIMKLIWLIRAVAFLAVIGTIGSVEIDRIDFYTAFLQVALGFALLILSNFWAREIKKAR